MEPLRYDAVLALTLYCFSAAVPLWHSQKKFSQQNVSCGGDNVLLEFSL